MKNLACILGAAVAIAFAAPAFAAVNLVQNGEFTAPAVGGGYTISSIPHWYDNAEAGGVAEVGNSALYGLTAANPTGTNLEVNAYYFGDVAQTVTGLTAGTKYTLSFLYGGRTGGGTQALDVLFGHALLATDTGSIGVWTPNSYTFTASGAAEVLEFRAHVTDGLASYGNEITNVSITAATTAVPEASTWLMMLAGFAGLGFVGYRRPKTLLNAA
jgi:hypothetical protein